MTEHLRVRDVPVAVSQALQLCYDSLQSDLDGAEDMSATQILVETAKTVLMLGVIFRSTAHLFAALACAEYDRVHIDGHPDVIYDVTAAFAVRNADLTTTDEVTARLLTAYFAYAVFFFFSSGSGLTNIWATPLAALFLLLNWGYLLADPLLYLLSNTGDSQ